MIHLVIVSLLWSVSFGLIKGNLQGLDSTFVAFARLLVSLVAFVPFLRPKYLARRDWFELPLLGALQYGVMYALYLESYKTLEAHEVALFTVTTPIFVVLVEMVLGGRFLFVSILAAVTAATGAAVLTFQDGAHVAAWQGLGLLQLSNLCFAIGQVRYRRLMRERTAVSQAQHFALLYLGGAVASGLLVVVKGGLPALASITETQERTLLYLGLVPSALGFFLWNLGASRSTPGVLAVMNNAKAPLGVLVSLALFGERGDPIRLVASLVLLSSALYLAHRVEQPLGPAKGSPPTR
ncbi:MAG: EamA family transporter [Myxococcota bacterium]